MRKIIISFLLFFILTPLSYAEDCMHDPVYDQNWNAVVTTGARVRDIPCMETSVVITTLPVGEVVQVISMTDGYYKIRRNNGTEGWVGQWLITQTDKPFAPTPTTTCTTSCDEGLQDIQNHPYQTAIQYLYAAKIIKGYSDGTFRPNNTINRAEFTKIITGSVFENEIDEWEKCYQEYQKGIDLCDMRGGCGQAVFNNYGQCIERRLSCQLQYEQWDEFKSCKQTDIGYLSFVEQNKDILAQYEESYWYTKYAIDLANEYYTCFPDIKHDQWYAKYVCFAKVKDIISGYSDGNFYPNKTITFSEAAKIIVKGFGYDLSEDTPWYKLFVEKLEELASIPTSIANAQSLITRGEMAEIIYRLKLNITNKPSKTYKEMVF